MEKKEKHTYVSSAKAQKSSRTSVFDRHLILFSVIAASFLFFVVLFSGDIANAAAVIPFNTIVDQLKNIVTKLLLPVAIILCGWKIIYLAVVCGILGMDPLNMVSDMDNDGGISFQEVKIALLSNMSGFVKGILWIGGIFIIFQLVLTFAGIFAETFSTAFNA